MEGTGRRESPQPVRGKALESGTVKVTDSEAITGTERVSSHQVFFYAAVSVAVISRQICHLWAISWR
jgi:hypothetical protein